MDDEAALARRVGALRSARGWSLAEMAERSGVSRSMLSKVERGEASPTATVLLRIAAAFDLTIAELMTERQPEARMLKAAEQPAWTDPASGFHRRQVFISSGLPLELVDVTLPAGAAVAAPSSSYLLIRQVLWVLDGDVTIQEGEESTALTTGDRLEFGPPSDVVFRNTGDRPARYLVAVLRQ